MAGNKIQISWSEYNRDNYEFTRKALGEFIPRPDIALAISLKGGLLPESAMDRIKAIVGEHGIKMVATVTATWGDEDAPSNLRLSPASMPMFTDEDFQEAIKDVPKGDDRRQSEYPIDEDGYPACEHLRTYVHPETGCVHCSICDTELRQGDG